MFWKLIIVSFCAVHEELKEVHSAFPSVDDRYSEGDIMRVGALGHNIAEGRNFNIYAC